ncbi:MAG: hypothetical protein J07AB43_01940 [Candidatus Nanosalina sp. J07AB43]|nr:MAG: hypothetical protein J07AB43_01940 [Candidatus Nanosalina sp. J07AB43]
MAVEAALIGMAGVRFFGGASLYGEG